MFIYKETAYQIATLHIQMLAVFTERQQNRIPSLLVVVLQERRMRHECASGAVGNGEAVEHPVKLATKPTTYMLRLAS